MFTDRSSCLTQQEKLSQAKQKSVISTASSFSRKQTWEPVRRTPRCHSAAYVLKTGLSQNICTVKTTVPAPCVCACAQRAGVRDGPLHWKLEWQLQAVGVCCFWTGTNGGVSLPLFFLASYCPSHMTKMQTININRRKQTSGSVVFGCFGRFLLPSI